MNDIRKCPCKNLAKVRYEEYSNNQKQFKRQDNTYKITNYETHLLSLTMNMSDNKKVRKEDKFLEDKKEEDDEVKVILSK